MSGKRFGEEMRGHWSIESLHWVLDANFPKDDSRTREWTWENNLSWLPRFSVSLLKRHPVNNSLRGKMLRCLMSEDFLTEDGSFGALDFLGNGRGAVADWPPEKCTPEHTRL